MVGQGADKGPGGAAAEAAPESLDAVVERVVFQSEESGWAVLRVRREGGPTSTAVGRLFGLQPGERVRLSGEWQDDRKYGRQFRALSYLSLLPETLEGIQRYLGSGLVPGIGPVMAERLVEKFGLDTLRVIDDEPEKLGRVRGIGPVRSQQIREAWREQRAVRDAMVFLQGHGLSASHALKICKSYGESAITVVKQNPFRLAEEVFGIGFSTADRIAESLGIPREAPQRAEAGVLFSLARAADEGHVYLPRELLLERSMELLEMPTEPLAAALDALEARGALVRVRTELSDALYLPALHVAEVGIAERLHEILAGEPAGPGIHADRALEWVERRQRLELGTVQRQAVRSALVNKVQVITGGPGTGKTTLIRSLVSIFSRKGLRLGMCAPTGRAAKRLAEATGLEAKTIHRLLEFDPRRGGFQRHAERRLDVDVVIVDESSMVDTQLAWQLFQAVPEGARLVLVGDVDQLASVGPGKVLEEVIRSERVPVTRLTEIYRQAEESRIILNAHLINRGQMPEMTPEGRDSDFFFFHRQEPEEVLETLLHLVTERVPRGFGIEPLTQLQVLTPMRRGLLGAENLNRELQSLLNPSGASVDGLKRLRNGDRVMQIRNNYDLDVFNGDIGRVSRIREGDRQLEVDFDGRTVIYDFADQDELTLAYACSVHKAQGSEYPCVVMPLHTQHFVMLQRNLLYTAVTRAARLLILVGDRRALGVAVRNHRQQQRFTRLGELLHAWP
jgi:exodeoxyribonuclease V alpha subunit